ncbi:MAG: hypothetical protein GY785_17035 [Gammaproteobacteria bacterium]|nr:hypothetical protein [Gammaproteobacteria bacterium]
MLRAGDLLQFPLLQLDSVDPTWTGWELPLSHWGCDISRASFRRFNNYVVALQAAEENQGIVLGWHSQVGALVERGKLVRIGDMEIEAPGSFYLAWSENRRSPNRRHGCATGCSKRVNARPPASL